MTISMTISMTIVSISWLSISRPLAIISMVSIATISIANMSIAISMTISISGLSSSSWLSISRSLTIISMMTIAISMTITKTIHDHNIHILAQPQRTSCHSIHDGHIHIHVHNHGHIHDHSSHIQAQQQPYPKGQEKQQPEYSCCQE